MFNTQRSKYCAKKNDNLAKMAQIRENRLWLVSSICNEVSMKNAVFLALLLFVSMF
jgi:hypothetical protein